MKAQIFRKLMCDALRSQLATGKRATLPAGGDLIWSWFGELNRTRTMHPAGPNPIAFAEIDAWARLSRWPLQPHHVEVLRAMDDAWLDVAYASRKDGKTKTPIGALSADAFDAVFG